MAAPSLTLTLPDWAEELARRGSGRYATDDERMGLALELARRNIAAGGGPFGAAVFERDTGRLVSVGVNLVMPLNCCVLHAEVTAIIAAQRARGTFDLGGDGLPAMDLAASTEPCAMCYGAIMWSGIRRLLCGARDEDARGIGFDEGAKLPEWEAALRARGVEVVVDLRRAEAAAVLRRYRDAGGVLYNARQGAAQSAVSTPANSRSSRGS